MSNALEGYFSHLFLRFFYPQVFFSFHHDLMQGLPPHQSIPRFAQQLQQNAQKFVTLKQQICGQRAHDWEISNCERFSFWIPPSFPKGYREFKIPENKKIKKPSKHLSNKKKKKKTILKKKDLENQCQKKKRKKKKKLCIALTSQPLSKKPNIILPLCYTSWLRQIQN